MWYQRQAAWAPAPRMRIDASTAAARLGWRRVRLDPRRPSAAARSRIQAIQPGACQAQAPNIDCMSQAQAAHARAIARLIACQEEFVIAAPCSSREIISQARLPAASSRFVSNHGNLPRNCGDETGARWQAAAPLSGGQRGEQAPVLCLDRQVALTGA